MKKIIFSCLIILLFQAPEAKAQCFNLVWSDEFDGTTLDLNNWNYEVNCDGGGNNELQCYTNSSNNVSVAGGKLTITAIEENYLGHDYTSGRINTKNKVDFQYGKVEASLKLPYGQGLWPAFWMLPTDNVYGTWPNSGEIDIMELLGQEPNKTYGTLHTGPPYAYQGNNYTLPTGDFSDAFHVFGIEWEPNEIRWYIDGVLFSTLTPANISPWAPFQEEFHLLLNVAVGGNWPGSPDGTTTFPQTMEAEWVRVYEEIAEIVIEGETEIAANQTNTSYSIPEISGATYTWSTVNGGSIVSGSGTNSILIDWDCDGGIVQVEIAATCGTEILTLNVSAGSNVINGTQSIQGNDTNVDYSIPEVFGATYSWTVPSGVTINSGQGTNSINVDFGASGGLFEVSVTSSCGTFVYPLNVFIGPVDIFCNFEDLDLSFSGFGGNNFDKISNPVSGGINTSPLVGRTISGFETWAGVFADLGGEIDFSTSSIISMKVYSPIVNDLVFKIEDISGGTGDVSRTATATATNEWVEYFFDFSGEASNTYDRITLFFDFGTNASNTFYFDDIFLGNPGSFPGCTDPNANNFNSSASSDDGSCEYFVEFNVDMNCETGFTNVYLTGPDLGWCGTCVPLSDSDGDGVYSNTLSLPAGEFEYKYQVDNWASQEDLVDDMLDGASCAPITDYSTYANRTIDVGTESASSDTYGSCSACFILVLGCTYDLATNYNPNANDDDGSCNFEVTGSCLGDTDNNNVVNVLDLISVSSNFGNICD